MQIFLEEALGSIKIGQLMGAKLGKAGGKKLMKVMYRCQYKMLECNKS